MRDPDSTLAVRTVLFLDHTARLGGAEIALFHLLQQLDKTRFEPVAVLGEDGPLAKQLNVEGIETHILTLANSLTHARKDSLGFRSLLRFEAASQVVSYCKQLSAFIRERRVVLIHTNSLKADIIGGICAAHQGSHSLAHPRPHTRRLPPAACGWTLSNTLPRGS
ncbi:MAG: hypothetical protein WCL08_02995 [Verrucomicrobiota bacterium]